MTKMFNLNALSAPDSGTQRLASILMAISEINKNSTLLPNTTIKVAYRDSRSDEGKAFFAALNLANSAFNVSGVGKAVDIVIGAQSSGESTASAQVFKQFHVPQISMSSTSALLSLKTDYPYFSRICPSDTFQGMAMASLLSHYGW
jgi:ABC-type branched-subunit amino acid transport system substrate-binding protein